MSNNTYTPRYSPGEEIANSLTHGIGTVVVACGAAVLIVFASIYGDPWHIVSCSVFSGTLILLYLSSTLYHSIQKPRAKKILRAIDHSAILLLIAGTYTPFTIVSLRGGWGWSLFGVAWGLAVLGIIFEVMMKSRARVISILLYVFMGWLVLIAINPIMASVATGGLILLVAGGIAYTGGIIFYIWRRLPFNHAIWHVFVLAGSILHFCAIFFYVVPVAVSA